MERSKGLAAESSTESVVDDLVLLIECVKYQGNNIHCQEQAFKTIASLCHTSDEASNYLIHSDGLQYILKIIFNTISPNSLKVACLHALCGACQNNAYAQQVLSEENIFVVLRKFLTMKSDPILQSLSGYLLICLATNNEKGQILARRTKCLETLRYLFKDVFSPSCSPRNPNRMAPWLTAHSDRRNELINLWQTATNALSVCVNNPQNHENQVLCSSIFPASMAYLRNSQSSVIQTTTLGFMTNCLANNYRAQVSFRLVGGLRVLYDLLRDELSTGTQVPSSLLSHLILTLEAAVCGNQICQDTIGELGVMPLLLQGLQICFGSPTFKVECLMTIAACIEECGSNCREFLSNEGVAIVVKLLAENQNCEELRKSATCVLQTYMEQSKFIGPQSLDELVASKLILPGSLSAGVYRKGNNSLPLLGYTTSSTVIESCTASNTLEDVDKSEVAQKVCNYEVTNVPKESTPLSNSDAQSDQSGKMDNQIKDLTEEVRSLKQLFTNNEKNTNASIIKDVHLSLMKIINTVCNSKVATVSRKEKDTKEACLVDKTNTASDSNAPFRDEIMEIFYIDNNKAKNCSDTSFPNGTEHTSELSPNVRESNNFCFHEQPQKKTEATGTDNDDEIYCQSFNFEEIQKETEVAQQGCLGQNEKSHEEEDEVSPLILPDLSHNNNEILHPAGETSHAKDKTFAPTGANYFPTSHAQDVNDKTFAVQNCFPRSSSDDDAERTTLTNIRYGATPDKQATVPNNERPSKKSSTMRSKPSSRAPGSKRPLRIPLQSSERDVLADIISEVSTSEPSCDELTVIDEELEECDKTSVDTPIKSFGGNQTRDSQPSRRREVNGTKCVGCFGDFTILNSRNLLTNLRSNEHTCSLHRDFVAQILSCIRKYKKHLQEKRSPNFDFMSSPKLNVRCYMSSTKILKKVKPKEKSSKSAKVPFSEREIKILHEGVKRYGQRWSVIERNCQFSVKRSAKTLKQKFQRITKNVTQRKRVRFSTQEEHNLKQGVLKYGYNWKKIINRYKFKEARTPQNLKDKWRNLTNTY